MKTVTVCVGSSCHIKGARQVIAKFDELRGARGLTDRIELKGCFCMERCGEGLNWQIDEELVSSRTVDEAVATFLARVVDPLASGS
jgi:NADH:ubiquinone oxidoreductase subunit E